MFGTYSPTRVLSSIRYHREKDAALIPPIACFQLLTSKAKGCAGAFPAGIASYSARAVLLIALFLTPWQLGATKPTQARSFLEALRTLSYSLLDQSICEGRFGLLKAPQELLAVAAIKPLRGSKHYFISLADEDGWKADAQLLLECESVEVCGKGHLLLTEVTRASLSQRDVTGLFGSNWRVSTEIAPLAHTRPEGRPGHPNLEYIVVAHSRKRERRCVSLVRFRFNEIGYVVAVDVHIGAADG